MKQTKSASTVDKEKTVKMLRTLWREFSMMGEKKPNDQVNNFKLKYINKIVADCNELLGDNRPFEDFAQFEEELLPTNSDVSMILNLYHELL